MKDNYEFISLNSHDEIIQELSPDTIKMLNVEFSKLKKQSIKDMKSDECYFCRKKVSGLCNSHTVPAFTLRNIAVKGKLYSMNSMIQLPFMKDKLGVNESGTFHIICKQCDGTIFQDYEKEEAYTDSPACKILAEISLKNSLKAIYKRKFEHQFIGHTPLSIFSNQLSVGQLDLREYEILFETSKRVMLKNWNDEFYLSEYIQLNYTVPVAFQGLIALYIDLCGKIINDIYNYDPNYKIKELQLAVFPLKNKSVIMLFVEKGNRRYREFFKQLSKLSELEKLKIINYMIFAYTEDFLLSPNLDQQVLNKLKDVAAKTSTISLNPFNVEFSKLKESSKKHLSFDNADQIPNILSEQYKIDIN